MHELSVVYWCQTGVSLLDLRAAFDTAFDPFDIEVIVSGPSGLLDVGNLGCLSAPHSQSRVLERCMIML